MISYYLHILLTLLVPPTPSLYLNLENINSSSISVSWTVTGVSPVATVTVSVILSVQVMEDILDCMENL